MYKIILEPFLSLREERLCVNSGIHSFLDDTVGGKCSNEGWPCLNEKNGICVDGWCVCRGGFHRIAGSCIEGIYASLNGIWAGPCEKVSCMDSEGPE